MKPCCTANFRLILACFSAWKKKKKNLSERPNDLLHNFQHLLKLFTITFLLIFRSHFKLNWVFFLEKSNFPSKMCCGHASYYGNSNWISILPSFENYVVNLCEVESVIQFMRRKASFISSDIASRSSILFICLDYFLIHYALVAF